MEPLKILIIDDNRNIHEDFRKILGGDTLANAEMVAIKKKLFHKKSEIKLPVFELDSAYQGEEGLEFVKKSMLENHPYALVILDIFMPPGWDGIQTLEYVFNTDPNVQIVLCTALSNYSWKDILNKIGQTDRVIFLRKPFDVMEARQLIYALTEKWRLEREVQKEMDNLVISLRDKMNELSELLSKVEIEESQFLHLIELSPFGLYIHHDEKIIYANTAFIKMIGAQNIDELIGKSIWEFIHPDFYSLVKTRLEQLKDKSLPAPWIEEKYLTSNNQILTVEIVKSKISFKDQSAVLTIVRDVTETRTLADELEESNQLLQTIFSLTKEAVFCLDENYNILLYNPMVKQTYGYTDEELHTMSLYDIVSAEDQKLIPSRMQKVREQSAAGWQATHTRKNGENFLVDVNIKSVKVGDKLLFLEVVNDLTKL